MKKIFVVALLLLTFCGLFAKGMIAPIFSDNMVLQRDKNIQVWGVVERNAKVQVTFDRQIIDTVADKNGKYKVMLMPMKANKNPQTLTVKTDKSSIQIKNVLVGEVWLCSGQSNMGFALEKNQKAPNQTVSKADDNLIRFIHTRRVWSKTPVDDPKAQWQVATNESLQKFSAVAYFFGQELQEHLDVPIGLIGSYWGSTGIEAWTSPEGFEYIGALEDFNIIGRHSPTSLYNGMIYPFKNFPFRGMIWYQGERNRADGELYTKKLEGLYNGAKKVFNNPDMAFYFVQLAPFNYKPLPFDALPKLWEAQVNFAKNTPKNVDIAIINDYGDLKDIHPTIKQPVGVRLSLLARKYTYNDSDLKANSPTVESYKIKDNKFILTFKDVENFVNRSNDKSIAFEVANDNNEFKKAKFEVDKNKIVVYSDEIKAPIKLRFMWNCNVRGVLFNEVGLPLGAFRIEK